MVPRREAPQGMEERGTVNARYARFFWPVLRGMVLIVALCAFIPFLAGLLYGVYGGRWLAAMGVFVLASWALTTMIPEPETLPASGGEVTARYLRPPDWSLVSYLVIVGMGFNWVCVFLWFSRRYGFFSAPVVGVTGLILVLYAAIALLLARLSNWRIALIFAIAACAMGGIVLRLG